MISDCYVYVGEILMLDAHYIWEPLYVKTQWMYFNTSMALCELVSSRRAYVLLHHSDKRSCFTAQVQKNKSRRDHGSSASSTELAHLHHGMRLGLACQPAISVLDVALQCTESLDPMLLKFVISTAQLMTCNLRSVSIGANLPQKGWLQAACGPHSRPS